MDKEKFKTHASEFVAAVAKITSELMMYGSAALGVAWLDYMIMKTWDILSKKDQLFWSTFICCLPTISANVIFGYLIVKGIRSVAKRNDLSEESTQFEKPPLESSEYFSIIINDIERGIRFEEILSVDLTSPDNLEEQSLLTLQFQDKYDPAKPQYTPQKLQISFHDEQHSYTFPWGIQAHLKRINLNSFPQNCPMLKVGLEEKHFESIEIDGEYYFQLENTPIHFSHDLHTLFILKNGHLEIIVRFDEAKLDKRLEPEFLEESVPNT